jgi:cellulose synthase/poly-beta-1,6-N-acetylglucosamine synthase-like glycosyltransferase
MDLSFISIPAIIIVNGYALIWILFGLAYRVMGNNRYTDSDSSSSEVVSAIVPACNEKKVIEDLIRDVDDQIYRNMEIIVVVHNSKDDTYERAKRVKTTHPRLIINLHTNEAGKSIALQHALKYARGSLVAFFDADNRIPSTFIQNMVKRIGHGYDCVQALILAKNPDCNRLTFCEALELEAYQKMYSTVKNRLGLNAEIGGTGFIIKRAVLDAVGGFHNRLIDDFDLALRLTLAGYRIAFTEHCHVYDEKPVTWKALMRQRSRWMAGHLELMKYYSVRPITLLKLLLKDPFKLIYLFSPINIILTIAILAILPIIHFTVGATYFALPLPVWVGLSIVCYLSIYAVLKKINKNYTIRQTLKYVSMLAAFSLHWYPVLAKSFFVRSWANTKTEHGFV